MGTFDSIAQATKPSRTGMTLSQSFRQNSPHKTFLIRCPGLVRLPSGSSQLFASEGFASWYSASFKELELP